MFKTLLLSVVLAGVVAAWAQPSGLPVDVPRAELFVADQIFRYPDSGNYNLWSGAQTPHRHALMMETLWYRDQETGERVMGVAVSGPDYNDDFTQMTVSLRDNLFWSDGIQFTADDLVFTVETIRDTEGLVNSAPWRAQLNQFGATVEKLDDFTVRFNLTESNPRFHTLFETRWNAMYMMPKHAIEQIDDLVTSTLPDPVVLGAYRPIQADATGFWELFERRDDWERTPAGVITANPGPKYIMTIFYGDSARKAIAMSRGELDVYFDADFEAFETTLDGTPTARSWYTEFPWAYPNEVATRFFSFNQETDPIYANKDVRWALTLALDIVELQTEYIGGVAKVTPMPIPPTASLSAIYLDPLEDWLQSIEIDLGNGEMYSPYDPSIPEQIALWAERQGYAVPGTPREVFGTGWWRFDPDAAEKLLVNSGFSRASNGRWLKPDGSPWRMELQSPPDENDAFRMANAAADMWSDFGIEVNLQGLERNVWDQNHVIGQYQVSTPWHSFALASGDAWSEIRGYHPDFYVPNGEDFRSLGSGLNHMRINDPVLGDFIDAMADLNPESAENIEVMQAFLKYFTEEMYFITTISFKKFVTWDERYWTGFPTAESPDFMPLYWFHGGKFAFQGLESTQ